jgi:cytoskeletal protein CcmA (bactofilin family)
MWRKTDESKPASSGSGAGNVPAAAVIPAAPPRMPEKQQAVPVAQPQETVRTIAGLTAEVVTPGGVLTSSIKIKGEIRGSEDLYVDGEVHGSIQISGCRVTVGPHGRVIGDIEAREIVVRGQVQGALQGRERVEIARSGELHGDITTARISIEDGARIHGKAEVLRGKEPPNRRIAEKPATENLAQPLTT